MPNLSKSDRAAKVTATEAERRRKVALAEIREMERDQKRGSLLPADEVREAVLNMLTRCKNRLLGIPDNVCDKLAGTSDPVVCKLTMQTEIYAALEELSEYPPPKTRKARGRS